MKIVKMLLVVTLLLGCQKHVSELAPKQVSSQRASVATVKTNKAAVPSPKVVAKNEPPKQQVNQATTEKNVAESVSALTTELAAPAAITTVPVPSTDASIPERVTANAAPVVDAAAEVKAEIPAVQNIEATQPEQVAALDTAAVSDAVIETKSEDSVGIIATPVPTLAPAPQLKISGTMQIDFQSRDGAIESGVDTYKVDITTADALRTSGTITRKPRVVSSILGREKSPLELVFALNMQIFHPESGERKEAGRFDGTAAVSRDGVYTFAGEQGALSINTKIKSDQGGVSGKFAGSIKGKPEESEGLLRSYSRWIGGKKVSYQAQHTDPLEFKNLILAAGPIALYPQVSVSGNLDYDYDTGNWLTSGITMQYRVGSESVTDKITGSIKWVEDPNRQSNGRGQYQFNLRYNEDKFKKPLDEGEFFTKVSDEEAFFMVDDGAPLLSGTISYQDRTGRLGDSEEVTVLASKISYDLSGRDLTKLQLVNFLKLWLLLSGPVNDE